MHRSKLGTSVAQVRIRRSITQEQLAERAGVSKVTVSQLEQGRLNEVRLATLYALADSLQVTVERLLNSEDDTVQEQDNALLLPIRRLLLPIARPAAPADEEELALARFRKRVLDCTADYDQARYTKLITDLPKLIGYIDAATGLHENEDKANAYRLLAHAYILTARLLIQLRDESLACEAVRRAMEAAAQVGDPILRAAASLDYSWAYRRQMLFGEAEEIATSMAEEIGEPSMSKSTPEHLAVWGKLLTLASLAAAQNNRPDTARELLSVAHSAAVRIGGRRMDYGRYWAEFSPATIACTMAENTLDGGDAQLALRLGRDIRRVPNMRMDAWTFFLVTMANAQTATRDYGGAIERMRAVRELAPEWVKNHRVAHDVVLGLLDATSVRRARASGLAELAGFMGVRA